MSGSESSGASPTITIRYFAGARAAAGVGEETAPAGWSLEKLAADLTARRGPALGRVLEIASFLVDGVVWRDRQAALPAGATLDVLPPFAGG
ncbi:MoaD/ThiS family protein [Rhizomonospora bruguierae]|uniref:MoaD/ThiS family protein n=1 Tax=Rhizomonospora bruguierae TaxID=1581705 RepID=UPI001BCCCE73|nr:MoaD/ThiS family protein [Micromonospora sp. NBRC 107566]